MKLLLNPEYEHLRAYMADIARHFDASNREVYRGRNVIRVCEAEGQPLYVKRYGIPALPNRLVYTFLRQPKGLRAYRYPQVLLAKGFETPVPVAYVEERRGGLIAHSYFVSLPCPYGRRFYEFGNARAADCADVLRAFARYTARLHEAGVMHLDYSPGNILFDQVDGRWHFSLVDTNRMRFGPVGVERGCRNFARLWGQPEWFRLLADEYAGARGADAADCRRWTMQARERFWRRYARRHEVAYKLRFD